ncbi:hypothetical protein ASD89_17640 [Caulobacter sp. Root656]|nr:hypothetical protein ASD89_17640 [Caulobacter sp. Root656]
MSPADAQQLRQEQEAFELNRNHAAKWFVLHLVMAYCSVVLVITFAAGLGAVLTFIVLSPERFSGMAVAAAAFGLAADLLGAVFAVWKLVLGPGSMQLLQPISKGRR